MPDAEQTHHRVQFIGHGQNGPCLRGRNIVAGKTRLVLLVDCLRDFGRLSVIGRIVRTHKPLQVRKLTYHAGHQVTLGQLCRAHAMCRVGGDLFGNLSAQLTHPLALVQHRP